MNPSLRGVWLKSPLEIQRTQNKKDNLEKEEQSRSGLCLSLGSQLDFYLWPLSVHSLEAAAQFRVYFVLVAPLQPGAGSLEVPSPIAHQRCWGNII